MSEKNVEEKTSLASNDQSAAEGQAVKVPNYIFKLDMRLIPILGCTYTILFLDRTNSEPSVTPFS